MRAVLRLHGLFFKEGGKEGELSGTPCYLVVRVTRTAATVWVVVVWSLVAWFNPNRIVTGAVVFATSLYGEWLARRSLRTTPVWRLLFYALVAWPGLYAMSLLHPFWFEHQEAAFIVGVILVTATTTAGLVGLTVRRQQRQQHP